MPNMPPWDTGMLGQMSTHEMEMRRQNQAYQAAMAQAANQALWGQSPLVGGVTNTYAPYPTPVEPQKPTPNQLLLLLEEENAA